jgi:hypothetical protein
MSIRDGGYRIFHSSRSPRDGTTEGEAEMSDIDPRNWSRQHQIALIVAVVVGMVLGGVVGLTASEVQPPAFMYSDAGGGE